MFKWLFGTAAIPDVDYSPTKPSENFVANTLQGRADRGISWGEVNYLRQLEGLPLLDKPFTTFNGVSLSPWVYDVCKKHKDVLLSGGESK